MKTLKLISIRLLLCSGLFFNATAQNDVVGLSANVNWEQRINKDSIQISTIDDDIFDVKRMELSAKAHWIDEQTRICIAELPINIIEVLINEYEAYAVLEVDEIETSVRSAYKIRILQDDGSWDIFVSPDAEIIMDEKISSASDCEIISENMISSLDQ